MLLTIKLTYLFVFKHPECFVQTGVVEGWIPPLYLSLRSESLFRIK